MPINCVGGVLHPKQKEIADNIINSKAMFHTVCSSRQFGKSYLAIQLMLYFALNNKRTQSMLTTTTYSQANKIFKELLNGIDKRIIAKNNASENSIIFLNGSELYFKSIQQPDNLRGYSIDYLSCDEAAMYDDYIFPTILRPFLNVKGKKCILYSTPKGKNWFHSMYNQEDKSVYQNYHCNYNDNPYSNLKEIEEARLILPPNIFRQEYLGEFLEDGGEVFENIKGNIHHKQIEFNTNDKYYAGLDLGRQDDYTVLTIVNSKNEIIEIYRSNKKEWSLIISDVVQVLNKYQAQVLIEVNNIGDVIYEMIAKQYDKCHPFVTTNNSKQDIIESLIMEFQNFTISITSNEVLIKELENFSYKYSTKSRKVIYGARTGHDDCVISLALANKCKKENKNAGSYFIY